VEDSSISEELGVLVKLDEASSMASKYLNKEVSNSNIYPLYL
jgi:hypothetical protein